MNEDTKVAILVVALAAVCSWAGFGFGRLAGDANGAERACQSVKMEWVKDRCMRVTREEVK